MARNWTDKQIKKILRENAKLSRKAERCENMMFNLMEQMHDHTADGWRMTKEWWPYIKRLSGYKTRDTRQRKRKSNPHDVTILG